MEAHWPENLAIDRKKLINGLVRGREFATQLQLLLHKPLGDHGSVSAEDLVEKILRSFTDTLSTLTSSESAEFPQNPETAHVSSPCSDDRSSEDSGESRKSPASKERRGSYKRRKISQTWTKFTPTPTIEDGHAWRKYGQKEILNAKYPRSYFRCTYKIDQGCQATKQVQRTEDDPAMYRITYMGHHTCKDMLKAPQLILDSSPRESYLLSFESNTPIQQDLPFPSTKREIKEEMASEYLTHNHSSSPDYLRSSDLTTFEISGPTTVLSSTPGSDHGDVISGVSSCTTSSYSLDMGLNLMEGSIDFDDVFHFDDDGFF